MRTNTNTKRKSKTEGEPTFVGEDPRRRSPRLSRGADLSWYPRSRGNNPGLPGQGIELGRPPAIELALRFPLHISGKGLTWHLID